MTPEITTKNPSLKQLLLTSLFIGITGYGGPAILVHMKNIIVNKKKWVDEKQFLSGLSMAQLLPGATGVTLMGYLGFKLKKAHGSIIMPFFYALPAFTFITILTWAYQNFGQLHFVESLFSGLGALVIALLLNAVIGMGKTVLKGTFIEKGSAFLIACLSFSGIFFFHINIIFLILFSGLASYMLNYFGISEKQQAKPSLNEKGSTIALHQYILAIAALALIGFLAILSPARQLFIEFFKIGLLAFGGGFTSIPLMQHEIVNVRHWVNLAQFRDGIAMGQITPGPVLITATFVGYIRMGLLGALVSTVAIFLPSLMGVLLLGRFHEQFKDHPATKSIFQGILAGFTGLLVATTFSFGIHSLVEVKTWGIFLVTAVMLIFYKIEPLWMIGGTLLVSLFLFGM